MAQQLEEIWGVDQQIVNTFRETGAVPIESLPAELQKTLLTAYLYEAITMSRDPEARANASERNRSVRPESLFTPGNLHHFSDPEALGRILQNGLLPGEFIADKLTADSYPFNVDLVESTSEIAVLQTHLQRLEGLASSDFGVMALHLVRGEADDTRPSAEYSVEGLGYKGQHRLIPGGISATEISAISLTDNNRVGPVRSALLEAGIFIPIFDANGRLLYSYEDYLSDRANGNYDVVVPEIVDIKFKRPNSQAGSNEGAEFIVPDSTPGAQPTRYYCKFAKPEGAEHIWSELLADKIYRAVSPRLVPETSAIILEGRLARASRMLEEDDSPVSPEARNAGFLLDCLVGNWDATYNQANLVMSNGVAVRIDTGNALFFRARGERKEEGDFDDIVTELESGGDGSQLGTGMRQNYPGLSINDVQSQATAIRQNLTDETIDELVDGVRMPAEERTILKKTLKARRDYILRWVDEVISGSINL